MNRDEIKENISREEVWLRGLNMVILFLAYRIAELIILSITLLQFLSTLVTKKTFHSLNLFSQQLSDYVRDIMLYLTYQSEQKPFPFTTWSQRESVVLKKD